jgi:hypothetical protein
VETDSLTRGVLVYKPHSVRELQEVCLQGDKIIPDFADPFSGLAKDRKLADAELVRTIRIMIVAEYEAIQLYMQLAESTDNQLAVDVL